MNGDWIAGVDSGGNWFLANIYTHQEISLPSSETCNIFREEWIGFPDLPPERYMTYGRAMFLLKIVICEVPTKAGHYSDYKLIALFNSGLAYLANGSQEWRLFSLASWGVDYSDAIEHNGFIVAVDGWTGTTYCWDQSQAGRGKGRPKRVGHSADPPQPSRFYVQLDGNDDMYMLVIPREFKQCLKGILPRPIKLKTSVGCAWYVHIDEYQGELVLKDGWFGFAEAHELQLDDLLVFEVKDTSLMNVLIYDSNTSTQRIIFCADHP
ncbi:hypothetical protein QYE76_018737 [Lolium multiflorum]|uniref:TF-B3 domain-containing protein n=1 Tax=Lolium multiflorum TaxID=4521 RepID=A0AAD8Q8R8_LOLMU|nr:hypothetical protein QYE76_018737 [Lolium multiflorum]